MTDNKEFEEWMNKVVENSGPKIAKSAVYTGLYSKNFVKDPRCALELGMAMFLDKPIAIIAMDGEPIPENVKKVATIIEHVDSKVPGDMKRAVGKIAQMVIDLDG